MENIKVLVDLLVELQAEEQYGAATIVGRRLKEEIYKQLLVGEKNETEVRTLQ